VFAEKQELDTTGTDNLTSSEVSRLSFSEVLDWWCFSVIC